MKINLLNLQEGLNQLTCLIRPEDLGYDEKEETLFFFPNEIHAQVEIQKFSDKYFIKVELVTMARYECDRCLDRFDENLSATFQLIYSSQSRGRAEDDDYRDLAENVTEIDLSSDIRENLILVIPMKHLCKEDCLGLCPHCGTNLNSEICHCEPETVDPRWEILKSLKITQPG